MRNVPDKLILLLCALLAGATMTADDFIDDVYYLPDVDLQHRLSATNTFLTPHYNKNVREIIFIDDTITCGQPDTVRAIVGNESDAQ